MKRTKDNILKLQTLLGGPRSLRLSNAVKAYVNHDVQETMSRILIEAGESTGPIFHCPKIDWASIIAEVSGGTHKAHETPKEKLTELGIRKTTCLAQASITTSLVEPQACRNTPAAGTDVIQRTTRSHTRSKVVSFMCSPLNYFSISLSTSHMSHARSRILTGFQSHSQSRLGPRSYYSGHDVDGVRSVTRAGRRISTVNVKFQRQ